MTLLNDAFLLESHPTLKYLHVIWKGWFNLKEANFSFY